MIRTPAMISDLDDSSHLECHKDIESNAEDSYARSLFGSGDMGVLPGRRYPVSLGESMRAKRWSAVMGSCEEEHLRGLEHQTQLEYPERYIRKLSRRPRTAINSPNERLIGTSQFQEAYGAVAYANSRGAILNTHVTLTWSLLGYEDDTDASAVFQSGYLKHMREWFRHKQDALSRPFAWIYAHERSASAGLHTHLLVSIPFEWQADFRAWNDGRLAHLSRRRPLHKQAVYIPRVRADRVMMHQWRQFGYLMKSVDPRARLPVYPGSAATLPLSDLVPWAHEGPGDVNCKLRIGIAQEIRSSARNQTQYRSLLDCGVTDVRLLFADYDLRGWQWAQKEAEYASDLDREGANLALMAVANERDRADEEFQLHHTNWLNAMKARDERSLEWGRARDSQLDAITRLFGLQGAGRSDFGRAPWSGRSLTVQQ